MERLLADLTFIALYGASYGMVLFTISVGLVVTMGLMRVINLGHTAFAAVGGYLAVGAMNAYGMPFAAAVLVAVASVAIGSILVERTLYSALYAAGDLEQVLLTVGVLYASIAALNFFFGPDPVPSRLPPWLSGSIAIAERKFPVYRLFVVLLGAALMLALWAVFDRTTFGAQLRAAVDNRSMAEAAGINVTRLFTTAFAIGSGLAALGGAVGFALLPLEPMYPFKYLTIVLIVVTLSGFGDLKASAFVALIVGIVDTALNYWLPVLGTFGIYLVMIALFTWRDRGLLSPRSAG